MLKYLLAFVAVKADVYVHHGDDHVVHHVHHVVHHVYHVHHVYESGGHGGHGAHSGVFWAGPGEFCGMADNHQKHKCSGSMQCRLGRCGGGTAHPQPVPQPVPQPLPRPLPQPLPQPLPAQPLSEHHISHANAQVWIGADPETYLPESAFCSGTTGLGAGEKPCAPWLKCYAQVAADTKVASGKCLAAEVPLGNRCGQAPTKYSYINVGRCPVDSHCEADAVVNPGMLGRGFCQQTPLEWVEDKLNIVN
ncbi:unnamed protein product [Effrenium voratum]|uniref:Uncharacterized protein n=1 Tax=Effrenium voratum TaxID=2562239 RepID=A0AA36N078_9DINO|nr:unnamed protein product [Effrenium voratum]CAJ1461999.1 unnamed protein product [Effrenium voratum]